MKRTITIIIAMLCVLFVKAQITITQADFGNQFYHAIQANDLIVDTAAIHVGAAGTNQTWNFAALHDSINDTLQFMTAASTPFAGSFLTANLAFTQNNSPGVYNFINSTSAAIVNDGEGLPAGYVSSTPPAEAVVANPPETYMTFPATYNTSFNGSSNFIIDSDTTFHYTYSIYTVPIDTVQIRNTTIYSSIIDAWGSITTPNGTYNCLRQKFTTYSTNNIWVYVDTTFLIFPAWYNSGVSAHDSSVTYRWFTNNMGFVLVEINMAADTVHHTWYPSDANWLKSTNSGINNINYASSAISLFPNPATSEINIINSISDNAVITIYDMMGNKIEEYQIAGKYATISIADYAAGLYFYRIADRNSMNVFSGKFMKE